MALRAGLGVHCNFSCRWVVRPMRSGARRKVLARRAGAALGVAALLLPRGASFAQDNSAPARELNTVLFGSLDGGRSAFLSAGLKRALAGSLDRDGFIAMGGMGFGAPPSTAASTA